MYLSRIRLNPHRRDARWLLSSPQRVHAAVLCAFPDPPTGEQGSAPRVLWRLDATDHATTLYVVSPEAPDFAHIAEQAGWPTTERGEVREYGPLLDRLDTGQFWAFRLTANPTRYVKDLEGGRSRRLGHVTARQQEQWLAERAAAHGFGLVPPTVALADQSRDGSDDPASGVVVSARTTREFERRGSRSPVTLTTARFDGVLEVRDPDLLRSAMVSGIGPAKAYGCGLLTLAPLPG